MHLNYVFKNNSYMPYPSTYHQNLTNSSHFTLHYSSQ